MTKKDWFIECTLNLCYYYSMTLFSIVLFPLAYAFYFHFSEVPAGKKIITAFSGLFIAAVVCAYIGLFASIYHLPSASFIKEAFHVFLTQIFIPLLLILLVLWGLCRKDSLMNLIEVIFPYCAGFYAVYLPFCMLQGKLPYPFYVLFMKPVLFLAMLYGISFYLKEIFSRADKKEKWIGAGLLAVMLFMPALTEGIWNSHANGFVTFMMIILSLSFSTLPFWYKKLLEKNSA